MSRIRVGICGHGSWLRGFVLPGLRAAEADIVGVVARSQQRADQAAEALGLSRGYADVVDLLAAGAQAVIVASPPRLHVAHALPVLRAGVPVLCEKPLGLNSIESAELVRVAGSTPALTGFTLRWHPALRRMRDHIRAGAIGDVRLLDVHYASSSDASPMAPWSWHHDRAEEPGGVLADLGAHAIDLARWLVGDLTFDGVDAATTVGSRPVAGSSGRNLVTNPDVASLRLTTSGAAVRILCSRVHPETPSGAGVRVTAFGDGGWVRWDATGTPALMLAPAGGLPVSEDRSQDPAALVASEVSDFLELAAGGSVRSDLPTLEDGHRAQVLIDAAVASIHAQPGGPR